MNIKTKALTTEQYKEIITTMKSGFCGCRPNERIATALVLEGNLGLRVSDILRLRPCDIVRDGDRYRLEIVEQKTGKARVFTVPLVLQQYIENYCLRCGIERADLIFPITERAVQKHLALVSIIWAMSASAHIAFANGMRQRFIKPTAMISPLSSVSYNIAAPPRRSATSALSRRGLKRLLKDTQG